MPVKSCKNCGYGCWNAGGPMACMQCKAFDLWIPKVCPCTPKCFVVGLLDIKPEQVGVTARTYRVTKFGVV